MTRGCNCQIKQKVFETGFALDDALLYLDTHPTDCEAMRYYQYVKKQNQEAVEAYQEKYGPLMINQVDAENWTWVKNPWPWEGEAN